MKIQLKSTALLSERYAVFDRSAAAIASSVLHDIVLITDSDVSHVVDKNKIRRGKQNVRAELCSKSDESPLQDLYLDGKKDDTLAVDLAHSERSRRLKKEEHYSLIKEPSSVYIDHVTPTSGSSEDIVTFIISYLSGRGIYLGKISCHGM
ncbi:hypothetical protein AVEN_141197-1 [Araneus ventricosus]|uniref:Uncharacterized protein n=1 Tax=Araneus ventricosus TaxID=182803 RepID=A0A4Y2ERN4_ARAVE|nr:hypothetical protein AVEN_141197-1 [Araneus ventricosus]